MTIFLHVVVDYDIHCSFNAIQKAQAVTQTLTQDTIMASTNSDFCVINNVCQAPIKIHKH